MITHTPLTHLRNLLDPLNTALPHFAIGIYAGLPCGSVTDPTYTSNAATNSSSVTRRRRLAGIGSHQKPLPPLQESKRDASRFIRLGNPVAVASCTEPSRLAKNQCFTTTPTSPRTGWKCCSTFSRGSILVAPSPVAVNPTPSWFNSSMETFTCSNAPAAIRSLPQYQGATALDEHVL